MNKTYMDKQINELTKFKNKWINERKNAQMNNEGTNEYNSNNVVIFIFKKCKYSKKELVLLFLNQMMVAVWTNLQD